MVDNFLVDEIYLNCSKRFNETRVTDDHRGSERVRREPYALVEKPSDTEIDTRSWNVNELASYSRQSVGNNR